MKKPRNLKAILDFTGFSKPWNQRGSNPCPLPINTPFIAVVLQNRVACTHRCALLLQYSTT